ncbi:MAG: N-acetylmuramoyl-L-alanine amidase [Cellulosilyticaceae bacterium]
MNKKLMTAIVSMGIFFMSVMNVAASPMALVYDGQTHLYNLPAIMLYLNGEIIDTYLMPPVQIEGTTLVPVREVFEPLGAFVEWKAEEKKVYIDYEGKLLILEMDNKEAWINGEFIGLDMPAKVINNKIMVPLRFVSEQMGIHVQWIGETREIHLEQLIKEEELPLIPDAEIPGEPEYEVEDTMPEVLKLENIKYFEGDKTLTIYTSKDIDTNQITIEDLYRQKQLIIDLGDNYERDFEEGKWDINQNTVKTITVVNDETTKLIVDTQSIHTVNIIEDEDKLQIELVKPKEKYDQIIMIDPGHGGYAPGTTVNSTVEKDVNLKQALAVRDMIESNTSIKVYMTKEDDTGVENRNRTLLANDIEVDFFVSIHNNYADRKDASGTEVFYYPSEQDNRSQEIAKIIQNKIIMYGGTRDRGIKPGVDLIVLNTSQMPAVLIEGGFLSNEEDLAKLVSADFTQLYAYAVYEAVVEIFSTLSFR